MNNNDLQKNPAIAGVIRNFVNKKSGKVVAARKDIKRRFDYLDWTDQRKIVLAFLLSTNKLDRVWIYYKLLKIWDESFYDTVQQLWEKYQEQGCGWLIVRYFPLAYIDSYKKELMVGRNYYFLCKRFMGTEGFIVEPNIIDNLIERLDILSLQKAPITDIESTLIEIIAENGNRGILSINKIHNYNAKCVSLLDIKPIYRAYNLLQKNEYHLGCRLMEKWDTDIRLSLNNSSELSELRKKAAKNGDLDRVVIDFSVKHILQYFSIEYNPDYFCWSAVTYGILPNKHIGNVEYCQDIGDEINTLEDAPQCTDEFQEECPF